MTRSLPLQLAVFDVDGTLVDSQAMILAAQARAFAACGLPAPSRQRSLSVVGLSLAEAFTALVGPAGPIEDLSIAYKRAYWDLRADPACDDPLYPGAREIVERLAASGTIRLGIATGKSRRGVDILLAREGWADLFATVRTSDDAPSKPDPTMIRQAMREARAEPADTVMIGDTTFDMDMARAAGTGAIGVSWGFHPVSALREAGASPIVDTFDALSEALDGKLADA